MFSQKLTVIKATRQVWLGGRPETGSGIYYNIYLIPNRNSQKIKIDSVWINNKSFDSKNFIVKNKITKEFKKRDTLVLKFEEYKSGKYNKRIFDETSDTVTKIYTPPIKYSGEALLRYYSKAKAKYLIIEKFQELEPIAYP